MNHRLRNTLTATVLGAALATASLAAQASPSEGTTGGHTNVTLAPSFLSALQSLGVTPGAISPGSIQAKNNATHAVFPIIAGVFDLGSVAGEIDHGGGLSLTSGTTRVDLTSFAIDLSGSAPVLTGIVTADGNFVGRIPLFDLGLSAVKLSSNEAAVLIKGVALTLDPAAATALSGVFHTTVPAHLAVGTANVLAVRAAALN